MSDAHAAALTHDVLADGFRRIHDQFGSLTEDLPAAIATYRPDAQANSIAWLLWHLSRVQDDHVADAAGMEQVWTTRGWQERFGLPFATDATGYGQSADEVAAVVVGAELLAGYHAEVHAQTMSYVDSLTPGELQRVVDTRWIPPVTVSVRLVSVIGDCLQHLGQAAYVRGLAQRAGAAG